MRFYDQQTMRRDSWFFEFFWEIANSDKRIHTGVLWYLFLIIIFVCSCLLLDEAAAAMTLTSRVYNSEQGLSSTSSTEAIAIPKSSRFLNNPWATLAMLMVMEVLYDTLFAYMQPIMHLVLSNPLQIAGVKHILDSVHKSSPYWASGNKQRYEMIFSICVQSYFALLATYRTESMKGLAHIVQ